MNHATLNIAIALTMLPIAPAMCSEDYWTAWGEKPEIIVVGTLVDVMPDEIVCMLPETGSTESAVFNAGWVEVESVLWGNDSVERVAVVWPSESKVLSNKHYAIGDKYIWAIWPGVPNFPECEIVNYRWFEALSLDRLDRVRAEIDFYSSRPWKLVVPMDEIAIGLDKSSCTSSRCPEYRVTIRGTGLVDYEGREHVTSIGSSSWNIDPADARRIVNQFLQANFFAYPSEYLYNEVIYEPSDSTATIRPLWNAGGQTVTLSAELGDRRHTVRIYSHSFDGLNDLIRSIDNVLVAKGCIAREDTSRSR